MDDAQLLRSYAADRSETAFAELVRRHLNLVYSSALRQANGDAHLAQDAAQLVFTDLARKAASLAGRPVLAGWLFTSTRYAVSKLVRTERRRQGREQEALLMDELQQDGTRVLDWERVRPVLDEALARLTDADREAVLLRFFEGRDYAELGARFRLTENAARMRVERALDKLQAQLRRRGLTSSTAALAAALANQAVVAAPAGLVATITGTAIAGASAAGLAATVAAFMSMNKLTLSMAGLIVAAGTAGFVAQARTNAELRGEAQLLREENQAIAPREAENLRLGRLAAEAESLRADDAALAQLNVEADALKNRMQAATQRAAQAAGRSDTYEARALDRLPRAKTQVRPEYPFEFRRVAVNGEAVVDFIVDCDGVVRQAYAVRSTHPEFAVAAVTAVSQWIFDPGQKSGRAVNTHMQVPIVFTMAPPEAVTGTPVPVSEAKKPSP